MIEKIRVEDAVGLPLLHDFTAIMEDGFKGVLFKKGHVVEESDIEVLKDIGKDHIYVGELEEDQVHEEDAIDEISDNLFGANIEASDVSEGKINLTSKVKGLFVIDRTLLRKINEIGDYTITCKKSYTKVEEGDRLAGARIVPLWTERRQVERAKEILEAGPIFEVKEFKKLKVGCIITGDEVYYGRIKDAFRPVLREKLAEFGAEVLGYEFLPDDEDRLVATFEKFKEEGADLVIFTGGMSVDPDDITPRAIRETHAEVIVQGIPMQPGNMLMVARLGDTYLMGVPGASIHSKVTSFDFFLPRVFAGIDLKREDFLEIAEGGLL
ncbi:Molybdopterin molybdenumtransferase [Anaerococcus prevotii]|uniref:Molybdopterin molybdenumtransferase n=1 Tax=Anaerococcus prevotii (strain ATCC 9321 / DSM 20548 / JCM 6508 / NCTC 11806 / PC1) TaxID=525919 RepID=C7RE47_ANAPD|nr:molybdopterin-binding protein [Anaerococcus prevotii]ACV29460.1 molybdenum cofactor synthesis domain protein [Anaerococcus prevotii DSM 20548]SUU95132.1 Molybdopterin molybdenumtransferase [Anaerococcus prevotii]